MARLSWAVALLASLALSGCAGSPRRDYDAVVTEGAGGPPIAGATIVIRPGSFAASEVTTDEQGRARFSGRGPDVEVRASGFVTGSFDLGSDETPELDIYRSSIALSLTGSVQGGDVGTEPTPLPERWDAQEVPFGASRAAREGYASRLVRLNVTLTWNNTPLAGAGDLAIALGPSADLAPIWHDSDERQTTLGPHSEHVSLSLDAFGVEWRDAEGLWAGAAAGKAYASALGLPYELALDAEFGEPRGTPGFHVGVLAALAGAALLFRRSRS